MKKLLLLLAVFALFGCSKYDGKYRGCWEVSIVKELWSSTVGGEQAEVLSNDVFVECDITETEVRKIITDLGGIPNEAVKIDNGDGTETRIFSSYKPVYLSETAD